MVTTVRISDLNTSTLPTNVYHSIEHEPRSIPRYVSNKIYPLLYAALYFYGNPQFALHEGPVAISSVMAGNCSQYFRAR
jgi:hypothetical protein